MANIITKTDFSKPYLVYGVTGDPSNDILNQLITYYEKIILTQILGEIEYNDYITTPAATEWTEFVDGVTYTHDSVSYVYPGIKQVLTKFIYYYWQVEGVQRLGEKGSLNPSLLNAKKVIPEDKMSRAWNESVDLIKNLRLYSPTVYNFLDHKQIDNNYFPDWEYTEFGKINEVGI